MKARNQVVAGNYMGYVVCPSSVDSCLYRIFKERILINRETVDDIRLVDNWTDRSTSQIVSRGIVGSVLGGSVGTLIGVCTTKYVPFYVLQIIFKSGAISMVEVDRYAMRQLQHSVMRPSFENRVKDELAKSNKKKIEKAAKRKQKSGVNKKMEKMMRHNMLK